MIHILKKNLLLILFVLFILHIGFRIFVYMHEYTTPFDASYWQDRYYASQWAISESKNPIGDDGLYAYLADAYIGGQDPVYLANPETPFLGKYLIGVSIKIFNNQNFFSLFAGFFALFSFYLLNTTLFKNKLFAFLPVFIFSFDELFYSQLRAPYLDTLYLSFLFVTLYFAIKHKYIVSSFFLGCFAATKYTLGSVFLAAPLILFVVIFRRKDMMRFFTSLVLWPIVFFATYFRHFMLGGTILSVLALQKYIFSYYDTGAKATWGIVFPMIFTGTWYTWFGGVISITEWNIFWPVSFVLSMLAVIIILRSVFVKKEKKYEVWILIILWVFSYGAFLTVTPTFPRYLLLLLPFMYNLSIWVLEKYLLRGSS